MHPTTAEPKETPRDDTASYLAMATDSGHSQHTLKTASPTHHTDVSGTAINKDTGKRAEYKELTQSTEGPRWKIAMCKELGRLFQGHKCSQQEHDTKGTDTCQIIRKQMILPGKKPTYVRVVADTREQKEGPFRVRCTVDGTSLIRLRPRQRTWSPSSV
jgi:hypothetical protein